MERGGHRRARRRGPRSRATSAARRSPRRSRPRSACELDLLPPDLAGQVRELQEYEFTSSRGPRALRRADGPAPPAAHAELLQPDGRGHERRLARAACSAMKDMLAELNQHARAARARRGARLRAASWSATATSSPRTRRTSTSCSSSWPSAWRPCRRCSTR